MRDEKYEVKADWKLVLGYAAYYLILQALVAAAGLPLGLGAGGAFWLVLLDWLLILLPAGLLLRRLGAKELRRRLTCGSWPAVLAAFALCWWLRDSVLIGDWYVETPFLGSVWLKEGASGYYVLLYLYELVKDFALGAFGIGLAVVLPAANMGAGSLVAAGDAAAAGK